VLETFASRFGARGALQRGGQCCSARYIRYVALRVAITCRQNVDGNGAVIDYEILKGLNGEVVIKEVGLLADNVVQNFHFKSPYKMASHDAVEKDLIGSMATYRTTSYSTC
jgi:hypothetical protein